MPLRYVYTGFSLFESPATKQGVGTQNYICSDDRDPRLEWRGCEPLFRAALWRGLGKIVKDLV